MTTYVDRLVGREYKVGQDAKSVTETYEVRGTDGDVADVVAASTASGTNAAGGTTSIPSRGDQYSTTSMRAVELTVEEAGSTDGERRYVVTVTYARYRNRATEPQAGDERWRWSDRDENAHIEVAYSQTSYGETAAEVGNLIGVKGDGSIDGVDVLDTTGELEVTKWYAYEDVTADLVSIWGALRKKTNAATFKTIFPAGSLQFLGYAIDPPMDTDEPTQVTFRFRYAPNLTAADLPTFSGMGGVGSAGPTETITITGGKTGHQYLWVQQGEIAAGTATETRVKGAYVATVYDSGDFEALGLEGSLVIDNDDDGS